MRLLQLGAARLPQPRAPHSDPASTPAACSGRPSRAAGAAPAAACQRHRPARGAWSSRSHRGCTAVRASATEAGAAWQRDAADAGGDMNSLQAAKRRLLSAVAGTERGAEAGSMQRGQVEEAQVAVEAFSSSAELDFSLLEGRWLLRYTTASDVLPLVAPARAGPLPQLLQIGNIYQAFSGTNGGSVQNIIEARLPPPPGLPSDLAAGVTLVVDAGWEARTARSIALTFREAGFQDVAISPALQNLLASPLLPRGWWNQQLLLAIKQLSLRVPLVSRLPGSSSEQQRPVGFNYMLTHLDDDMLIGRAQGNGGTFIFSRELPAEAEQAHTA